MAKIKKIKGFPDYYVSSAGNVWREKRNEFYLKLRPSKEGSVSLYANGQMKPMLVYRLVAMAFVPVPEQYQGMSVGELEVHHINFNHNDNRASNIMWLTKSEHKKLHSESEVTSLRLSAANKGEKNPMYGKPRAEGAGKPPKPVIQYTKKVDFVAVYASIHEAERLTNIAHQNICKCCNGRYNSAGGYIWKFAS